LCDVSDASELLTVKNVEEKDLASPGVFFNLYMSVPLRSTYAVTVWEGDKRVCSTPIRTSVYEQ
jgi:hypothetical protein